MPNPTLLTSPIAENGDKNVIPASTGATTGLLDQEHGFQQINELPLQAGGLPPQRKDFNGAFNLLSKILFYTQKGYVFDFDENQDYYASCIVKDTDGGLYCANADVSASSTHPKDDTTNWVLINFGFNKKETFTSSGSFTAPVTGIYNIHLAGGGGGGSSSQTGYYGNKGGGGGGQGGQLDFYVKLTAGTSYAFTIGAGGTGATAVNTAGNNGGDSSIVINGITYKSTGGGGGTDSNTLTRGGYGGVGYIDSTIVGQGLAGEGGGTYPTGASSNVALGGSGGGSRVNASTDYGRDSFLSAGGAGGTLNNGTSYKGGTGGNGYITFEYCDI